MPTDAIRLGERIEKERADAVLVQTNHVVPIQERILNQLPVAGNPLHAAGEVLRGAHTEGIEVRTDAGEVGVQIHRRARRGLNPDQAVALLRGQRHQPQLLRLDVAETLDSRNVAKAAVETVGPGVVGADQRTKLMTPLVLYQPHPAVAADVHEGTDPAFAVANRQQRQTEPVVGQRVARLRKLRRRGHDLRLNKKEALVLTLEAFFVRVVGDRHAAGAGCRFIAFARGARRECLQKVVGRQGDCVWNRHGRWRQRLRGFFCVIAKRSTPNLSPPSLPDGTLCAIIVQP